MKTMEDINTELTHFFATNQTEDRTPMMIWEAHKLFVRGLFIKHGARLKKAGDLQINSLLIDNIH